MKKFLITMILCLILLGIYSYYKEIIQFLMINVVYREETLIKENNIYGKNEDWSYIQITDDFFPNETKDILNIFYTALSGGWDEVTLYCPIDYKSCIDDVKNIANESYLFSNINNFVSTYNTYNKIYVNLNTFGRVNIKIEKLYSAYEIEILETKIDEIYNKLITKDMSDYDKILVIHDYIVNNTSYDQERADLVNSGTVTDYNYASNTAYGALIQNKAICGGYTDAMALFLDKMGIQNYKVSSAKHIWNFVYIDGNWKHLDLTWDDPIISTGGNILTHNFFLIDTNTLEEKNTGEHEYDKNIFIEAQ
ncbi:MAG: transglutaminase domain-containing protein [Bacilli bacterium]